MAFGDPADHLNVAQAARRAFYVGLEVVFGVAEFAMALDLFVPLGAEEFAARPDLSGLVAASHRGVQMLGAGDEARFHQVGGDGDVGCGGFAALRRPCARCGRSAGRYPTET